MFKVSMTKLIDVTSFHKLGPELYYREMFKVSMTKLIGVTSFHKTLWHADHDVRLGLSSLLNYKLIGFKESYHKGKIKQIQIQNLNFPKFLVRIEHVMFATYRSEIWFQVTNIIQVAAQSWTNRTQYTDLNGDI